MIVAALLALPGIMLFAAGTPRQTAALFGDRMGRSGRRGLRLGGFALLAASFAVSQIDADRARHLIALLGAIGVEAAIVALAFTIRAGSLRS
jgi:hypothetical protein